MICDIFRAFDRIWHKGLIHKRKIYCILGNILDWIENYLTYGQQRVHIEGFSSTFKTIDARVSYI